MNMAKILRDSLFASFLLVLLIVMSWATPFGFIGADILTLFGLCLLFVHVTVELMFLRL